MRSSGCHSDCIRAKKELARADCGEFSVDRQSPERRVVSLLQS